MVNGIKIIQIHIAQKALKLIQYCLAQKKLIELKVGAPLRSSRLDMGLMLTSLLTWASGESETKGKGGKKS